MQETPMKNEADYGGDSEVENDTQSGIRDF